MARVKNHDTFSEERNMTLFINYLNIIKRLGDHAKYITINMKITEAARPFFISTSRAQHIIGAMLRERGYANSISIMECNEILTELDQVCANSKPKSIVPDFHERVEFVNSILIQVGVTKTHEEVKQLVQQTLINK